METSEAATTCSIDATNRANETELWFTVVVRFIWNDETA
jgi:hypothetical protein